ncbi:MAG: energy transducer TonB [Acidobacteriota bacterium]|nr:energy transducer TonB [Acidobacteriota bacterium]
MSLNVIKRVLPFTLTLIIGAALGNFAGVISGFVSSMPSVSPAPAAPYKSRRGCRSADRFRIVAPSDDLTRAFTASELKQRAVLLSKPTPSYTEEARLNNASGTVKLNLVLGADGEVSKITVVNDLPYGLTEQAIEAARQIRFTPAQKDGRPVSQYTTVEYRFNIY